MTKLLVLGGGVMLGAVAMFAQPYRLGSAFQQPGWIAAPGSGRVNYPTLRPDAQSGPVSGRPFSATEVRHTVQTLADGTRLEDSSSSSFYRDAQGRMRSESPTQVLIYDPIAGFTYHLDLRNRLYQKTPMRNDAAVSIAVIGNRTSVNQTNRPAGMPAATDKMAPAKAQQYALRNSIHSRAITEELAPQIVNGIPTRGSRYTETIPAGTFGNDRDIKIVSERWVSDVLQVLVKSSNSDPRFGVTTYELTNISQAPPDPALFQVPTNYQPKDNVTFDVGHGVAGSPSK